MLLGGAGGSFSGPTNFTAGSNPASVAVGDFNGDGKPDLAVANPTFFNDNVAVLVNNTSVDQAPVAESSFNNRRSSLGNWSGRTWISA